MVNRTDLIDHINRLRDRLRLLALAALSLADAMHLGISEAKAAADEIKAMLENDTGRAASEAEGSV
jgi:hypothetical protein